MTTVPHARSYDKFIETKSNCRKKKLHRTNPILLEKVAAIEMMQILQSNSEVKGKSSILKDDFSSRIDPFILALIAAELLGYSNETK